MTYYTLTEAKRDHPLWFEPGAMRFFNTQLDREFHAGELALYLVYSNRYDDDHPRQWMVTRMDADDTSVIGPLTGFKSRHEARVVAEALAAREKHGLIRRRKGGESEFKPCPRCQARQEIPGWATFEQRYPMHPAHAVEQWLDVCSEHIVEAANVVGVVA